MCVYSCMFFFGWPDFKAINSISPKPHPIYRFRRKHHSSSFFDGTSKSTKCQSDQHLYQTHITLLSTSEKQIDMKLLPLCWYAKPRDCQTVSQFPTPQLPQTSKQHHPTSIANLCAPLIPPSLVVWSEVRIDTITIRLTTGAIHARLAGSTSCRTISREVQLLIWGCSLNQMISGNVSWGHYALTLKHTMQVHAVAICMRFRLQKSWRIRANPKKRLTFWRDII